MGYTKLFSEIITSTIWAENDETRIVWITMLALKDKWGIVGATVPGLAHMARVDVEVCRRAIDKFLAPDKDSRTPDYEGRRIEIVDGGWRILNHDKYRRLMSADERREYLAQKQREHRARQQTVNKRGVLSTPSTHTDADTKADADTTKSSKPSPAATDAEIVYALYPRKQGKRGALKAIEGALKRNSLTTLSEATAAFAQAVGKWDAKDLKFVPHPSTWFNDGRFDDDRTLWERNGTGAASSTANYGCEPMRYDG